MKPEIRTPCHQNWENMKIGMISRHCESCNKNVMDFTSYSREELLLYLINHRHEKTCGRLLQSQLDFHHEEILVTIEALLTKNKSKNLAFLLLPLAASILMNCSNGKDKQISSVTANRLDSAFKVTVAPADTALEDTFTANFKSRYNNSSKKSEELKTIEGPETMGVIFFEDISADEGGGCILLIEVMPEFNGGADSLSAFFKSNLIYPESEKNNKVEGTVYVSFTIESDGRVSNPQIVKGIGELFDKEVLRVVNSMPAWKPGEREGKKVAVNYTLPIKFKL